MAQQANGNRASIKREKPEFQIHTAKSHNVLEGTMLTPGQLQEERSTICRCLNLHTRHTHQPSVLKTQRPVSPKFRNLQPPLENPEHFIS